MNLLPQTQGQNFTAEESRITAACIEVARWIALKQPTQVFKEQEPRAVQVYGHTAGRFNRLRAWKFPLIQCLMKDMFLTTYLPDLFIPKPHRLQSRPQTEAMSTWPSGISAHSSAFDFSRINAWNQEKLFTMNLLSRQ